MLMWYIKVTACGYPHTEILQKLPLLRSQMNENVDFSLRLHLQCDRNITQISCLLYLDTER